MTERKFKEGEESFFDDDYDDDYDFFRFFVFFCEFCLSASMPLFFCGFCVRNKTLCVSVSLCTYKRLKG